MCTHFTGHTIFLHDFILGQKTVLLYLYCTGFCTGITSTLFQRQACYCTVQYSTVQHGSRSVELEAEPGSNPLTSVSHELTSIPIPINRREVRFKRHCNAGIQVRWVLVWWGAKTNLRPSSSRFVPIHAQHWRQVARVLRVFCHHFITILLQPPASLCLGKTPF